MYQSPLLIIQAPILAHTISDWKDTSGVHVAVGAAFVSSIRVRQDLLIPQGPSNSILYTFLAQIPTKYLLQ